MSVNTNKNVTQNGTPFSLIARRMYDIGFLPIPCRRKDKPSVLWSNLTRSSDIYEKSAFSVFDDPNNPFIAVASGVASGNLECIDFDLKYDLTGNLYERFQSLLFDNAPFLYKKLVQLSTPSGGKHLIYRCSSVGRNMKLARRGVTVEEAQKAVELNPRIPVDASPEERDEFLERAKNQSRVLIETRGNGGYFLTFPSPGYTFDDPERTFATLDPITDQEREILLSCCRSFDEYESGNSSPINTTTIRNPISLESRNGDEVLTQQAIGKYSVLPWEDYNERGLGHVIDVLVQEGWTITERFPHREDGREVIHLKRPGESSQEHSATYNQIPGKFWVWSTSTQFPSEKPLSHFDIYMIVMAAGDRKRAATMLFGEGFGKLKDKRIGPAPKSAALAEFVNRSADILRREALSGRHGEKADPGSVDATIEGMPLMGAVIADWWSSVLEQRRDGAWIVKKSVQFSRFVDFLKDKGFRRYFSFGKYGLVRITGHHVEQSDRSKVTEVVNAYIAKLPERFDYMDRSELSEMYMKYIDKLLGQNVLEALPLFDDEMTLRDTKTHAYIVFRNGALISHSTQTYFTTDLSSIGKYIWKEKVIDRPIHHSVTDQEMDSHPFSLFMYNIAGRDDDRYRSLLSLVGYSVHNYKDPAIPSAVILCDSKLGEGSEGGTGKGLLVKAMSYIRNMTTEDGKAFAAKNKTEFRFGRVDKHTDIFHLADLTKHFNFESLFSIITEGFPVRHLYKSEEYIPYSKSPKVVISTNFTVMGDGASHDRRRVEFELAPHYNQKYSPYHEFKHRFFDEWSEDQWSVFFHIMARCQRLYIQNGLPSFKTITLNEKKFIDSTSSDFVQFIFGILGTREDIARNGIRNAVQGKYEQQFDTLYNQYLTYAAVDRHETRSVKFKNMMVRACQFLGLSYNEVMIKTSSQFGTDAYTKYVRITDPEFEAKNSLSSEIDVSLIDEKYVQGEIDFDHDDH